MARSANKYRNLHENVKWISSVDVSDEKAGSAVVKGLSGAKLDRVIVAAGYMSHESFDEPNFEEELKMYKIVSIGPVFLVHHLVKAGAIGKGGKIVFVSSEGGSITLRHESEGGGMYGHHGSKAAMNMAGKCLSLDLKDKDIAVGMVHPGFMRTEMTRSMGMDKMWDEGGAVHPEEAADQLIGWTEDHFDMSKTGQFWAPFGPK